jgi:DNA polymerase III delta prime subunit
MSRNDFLWVEKYRPKTIEDCILPASIKKTFQEFLDAGELPNLLLAGPAGVGKTTVARALCEQLGCDYIVINGSDEGRFLDTVRNQAKNFASTVSLSSSAKHKVIIIDEADNTTHDVQLLLRANIEAFYGNCRFVFTCNYKNKIIEPLHSRCAVVEFSIPGKSKPAIAGNFFKRVCTILDAEGVTYDQKVIAELINKHFPDWRRVLNELQRYSVSGTIDSSILAEFSDVKVNDLIKSLLKVSKRRTLQKFVSGLSITSIMTLVFFCAVFTMLFTQPLKVLLLLPLFLLLLSTSIKLPLLPIRKLIFWRR